MEKILQTTLEKMIPYQLNNLEKNYIIANAIDFLNTQKTANFSDRETEAITYGLYEFHKISNSNTNLVNEKEFESIFEQPNKNETLKKHYDPYKGFKRKC